MSPPLPLFGPALAAAAPPPLLPVVVDQVEGPWARLELGADRFLDLPLGRAPGVHEGARLLLDPCSLVLVALPDGGALALHARPGRTDLPAHLDLLLPLPPTPAATPSPPVATAAAAGLPPGPVALPAASTLSPRALPARPEVHP